MATNDVLPGFRPPLPPPIAEQIDALRAFIVRKTPDNGERAHNIGRLDDIAHALRIAEGDRERSHTIGHRIRAQRDDAEGDLEAIAGILLRHQPAGSPPPGGVVALAEWVVSTLATRAKAAP